MFNTFREKQHWHMQLKVLAYEGPKDGVVNSCMRDKTRKLNPKGEHPTLCVLDLLDILERQKPLD